MQLGSYGKGSTNRFNLLLLEVGEFYFEDFSVFAYPADYLKASFEDCAQRKVQGRLKLCTRSVVFEPSDVAQPLVKYRFRKMKHLPTMEIFNAEKFEEFITFPCSELLQMKKNNSDYPYEYKTEEDQVPQKFIFQMIHSKVSNFLEMVQPLYDLAQKVMNQVDEEMHLLPLLRPRQTNIFDPSLLVDFRERPLFKNGVLVDRIEPLLKYPGCIMLSTSRVYFQPAQLNNIGDPASNYPFSKIERIYKRRHMLKQTGLEMSMKSGKTVFFSFRSRKERDSIYHQVIQQHKTLERLQRIDYASTLKKWQAREISNFDYLQYLNTEADRSVNDLTQYPVFPWIIADYDTATFDLSNPQFFRDLSKPVGALNPERLAYFKDRYEVMPKDWESEGLPPPFLYGTHYSTPGYVLFYLVRQAPEYMLCLQNGKFDAPDRLFKSISETWKSCLKNQTDLKELIPVFFDPSMNPSEWLENRKALRLGRTQKGEAVDHVELPPWASDPLDFVQKNRQALESDYVSQHLHEWIDLVFGFKQKGKACLEADNLFYHLSYEGSIDLETITDAMERSSLQAQIQEFGQTPKQLFSSPHPSRDNKENTELEIATEEPKTSSRSDEMEISSAKENSTFDSKPSSEQSSSTHSLFTAAMGKKVSQVLNQFSKLNSKEDYKNEDEEQKSVTSPRSILSIAMGIVATKTFGADEGKVKTEEEERVFADISPTNRIDGGARASNTNTSASNETIEPPSIFSVAMGKKFSIAASVDRMAKTAKDRWTILANTSSGNISSRDVLKMTKGRAGRWDWIKSMSSEADFQWKATPEQEIHTDSITNIRLSKFQSTLVFTTSQDAKLKVSNTVDGKFLRSLSCHLALSAIAVDSKEEIVFIGSWDSNVYMVETQSGTAISKLAAHEDTVSAICLLGDHQLVTTSWDSSIKIWEYTSGAIIPDALCTFQDSLAPIKTMDVDTSGRTLVAGSEDGYIYVYDLVHQVLLRNLRASLGEGEVTGLCFASDVFISCSADGLLAVFHHEGHQLFAHDSNSEFEFSCLASDGRVAITGGNDGVLRFWDLEDNCTKSMCSPKTDTFDNGDERAKVELFRIPDAHAAEITSIDVSEDGKTIATGARDGTVRSWTLDTKSESVFDFFKK